MTSKDEIAKAMFDHLQVELAPEIKKRIETTTLREVLLALADWVYLERFKALTDFTEGVVARQTARSEARGREVERERELIRAREKGGEERPSFLDALDEIG